MGKIAKRTMLLRGHIELPDNLRLATEEFREGWNIVRSGGARLLDREVRRRGWHFIRIGEGSLRGGVGQTSQDAIAGALKLALRCLSERFNAAEVENIELKIYPWFFLARVTVHPYKIGRIAVVPVPVERVSPGLIPSLAESATITGNRAAPAA
jgi:hypothetical protein